MRGMSDAYAPESVVHVFTGRGPRLNRIHIFDARTGKYLTSGFTRGGALFVRTPIDLARVTIREFDRRASRSGRPAGRTPHRKGPQRGYQTRRARGQGAEQEFSLASAGGGLRDD